MAVSPFMAQGIKLLSFSRPPSSSPSSSSSRLLQRNFRPTSVKASIAPEECNKEDFAPNKEVEKVSMEWVAEDKTKVVGTYPPVSREQKLSWTGYIEKDTAGQTNIYPVEVCDAPHLVAKKSSTAGSKTASSSLATTKKQWEDANVEAAYLSRSAHLVQWYPGHIAKTERELKEQLKLVDVVIQIRDARIPMATCHPEIDSWIGEKSKVLVLNRGDMISTADKNAWANYFSRQGVSTLFTDARHGSGSMKLARTIKATAKDVNEKRRAKGLLPRAVRAAVVGYPNVGKSSLINRLLKRKICQAAPKPGVTRELKWARIGEDLDLMDAPGVLPMRLDDQSAATRLAICNDIGESSYAIAGVACVLVELLKRLPTAGPQVLHKRYKIKAENIAGELFLEELAQRLFAGDINKASHRVLKDYREGKFGWIALERPPLTSMHSI